MISALDLGVERPWDAMMPRAPEAEALYEGNAQKGFGVSSLDGSPMSLGSTATHEPIGVSKTLWVEVGAPDATGLETLWIKKQGITKQINISDNQQSLRDKRVGVCDDSFLAVGSPAKPYCL